MAARFGLSGSPFRSQEPGRVRLLVEYELAKQKEAGISAVDLKSIQSVLNGEGLGHWKLTIEKSNSGKSVVAVTNRADEWVDPLWKRIVFLDLHRIEWPRVIVQTER